MSANRAIFPAAGSPAPARSRPDTARRRFDPLWTAVAIYLVISTLTRAALAAKAGWQGQLTVFQAPLAFGIGFFYDVVTSVFLFLPFAAYLTLAPDRWYRSRRHRPVFHAAFAACTFGLIYLGAVEYFFFDEFNSRFNFVAVEYLIYPHEVFVNIWDSYPVGRVLAAAAALTGAVLWLTRGRLARSLTAPSRFGRRWRPLAALAGAAVAAWFGVNSSTGQFSTNRVANELAQNGVYAFFSALRNSKLDYRAYYHTVPDAEAVARSRHMVWQRNAEFVDGAANPLERRIRAVGPPLPLHVIVLLQESLGAEFVGAYGDRRGLTPNLDRLASRSLVFSNVYATGTRTVRGMEAVSASFPPVPAESIVKRPRNEGLASWAQIMARQGYSPSFIYGGFGTFDNMNAYFGANGYRVTDRTDMDTPKFSNIWGVSDEDLFRNALALYDRQVARGERVFSIVMSTSNHKPFTFPAGVPGVPAKGGGREAGVRYADHAIGRFIAALEQRPWARDAMVVVVADHGARVYGREDIPLKSYEIPFLVYAPGHVKPRRIEALASQMDVAPTVMGLLNLSYETGFFGRDILQTPDIERFVLLNHNRDVAMLRDGRLTELRFRREVATYAFDRLADVQAPAAVDPEALRDAASVYQLAYDLYRTHRYTQQP
ncbi:MAG: LTA synthase family protein [Pseudomonadota bacterium]